MIKVFFCFFIFLASCSSKLKNEDDDFLWLEEIKNPRVDGWVGIQNKKVDETFLSTKSFKRKYNLSLSLLDNDKVVPDISVHGRYMYTVYRPNNSSRGIWKRRLLGEKVLDLKNWETVLDLDSYNKKENKSYTLYSVKCLKPEERLCLLGLSKGGGDKIEIKEFDTTRRAFVKGGFYLPEAVIFFDWLSNDSIVASVGYSSDDLTNSEYGRHLKKIKRSRSFGEADNLISVEKNYISVFPTSFLYLGKRVVVANIYKNINEFQNWLIMDDRPLKLPLPDNSQIWGISGDHLIFSVQKEQKSKDYHFLDGDLIAFALTDFLAGSRTESSFKVIHRSTANFVFGGKVEVTKNFISISLLENVVGKIRHFVNNNGNFVSLNDSGIAEKEHVQIVGSDFLGDNLFTLHEDFVVPPTLGFYDLNRKINKIIFREQVAFDSSAMTVRQFWATSKDGTRIPYFLAGKKEVMENGDAPVILKGYGGYGYNLLPKYDKIYGKLWMEKGGLYAQANIRGGGEFGSSWHLGAIKENRQKCFDDFIAVAESLIESGITTSQNLGIYGGSNGGLLVTVAMVQRPSLFKAVAAALPTIDMMRYTKLLAGNNWIGEYGDPDLPGDRKYILKYSPYQNLKRNVSYPSFISYGSASDDRVHPAHGRKMVAKMNVYQLNSVFYFESQEGGHSGSSTLSQKALWRSLFIEFFEKELKNGKGAK